MIIEMQNMQKKLLYAKSVEQVMGYEGTAAKIYFKVLGKLMMNNLLLKAGQDVLRWTRLIR